VVAGLFGARLIRSGQTSILFVLFPQKLASVSIDEMQPSAGLAGDSFVLVDRRVLIAVEPMLDFHPCYWAGEQQTVWHAFLIRGPNWSAMIWLNYKTALSRRHLRLDGVEEADELLVPVALHIAADDGAVEDVEGRE
jgi:hypothetical protein